MRRRCEYNLKENIDSHLVNDPCRIYFKIQVSDDQIMSASVDFDFFVLVIKLSMFDIKNPFLHFQDLPWWLAAPYLSFDP